MKKIVAAQDIFNPSAEVIAHFQSVADLIGGQLTIACLENVAARLVPNAAALVDAYVFNPGEIFQPGRDEWERQKAAHIHELQLICNQVSPGIQLQDTWGMPVADIVDSTRFADLLLVDVETSFATLRDTQPPQFVKDTLKNAECPVMVLPPDNDRIEELLFFYNGSFSSMYAIRQFTMLCPFLSHLPVQVICVDESGKGKLPHKRSLGNYMEQHYPLVEYKVLKGEPRSLLLDLLIHKTNCIATMGAYGRSDVSMFFHRSEADDLLKLSNIPLFITHP